MAMSLIALSMVLIHAAIFGIVYEPDEGTAAHVFQLLLAAQLPVVAYFVIRWLPHAPGRTLQVFALQVLAALAAITAAFFFT